MSGRQVNGGYLDRWIARVVMMITLLLGLFGLVLFTELGQLLNWPSAWLYSVHPHLGLISSLAAGAAGYVVFRHLRAGIGSRRVVVTYVLMLAVTLLISNFFVPELWLRAQHYTAGYISIPDADVLLDDEADMLVLEVNGEARGYPRDWLMVPHIAGDSIAGEEVVMTYCALSNLPQAFESSIAGSRVNLKVVSQVHNNLLMMDDNTGELYQQITGRQPLGEPALVPRASQRMPWRAYRQLYPEGKVFRPKEAGILGYVDQVTLAIFESGLASHYDPAVAGPLFDTLALTDERLPPKEQIWGTNFNGEQVAFSRSFLEQHPVYSETVGGIPIVIAYFREYETVGVFERRLAGQIIEVQSIDVYGNVPGGKLERLPLYPNVFWMVWSHWFPATELKTPSNKSLY